MITIYLYLNISIIVEDAHFNVYVRLLDFYRSAPKVILQGLYSHASDVWSFGVVAWEVYAAFTNGVSSREQTLPYFDLSDNEVIPYW